MQTGEICVNTLKRDWKSSYGLQHILLVLPEMLFGISLWSRQSNAYFLFPTLNLPLMKKPESCYWSSMTIISRQQRLGLIFMPNLDLGLSRTMKSVLLLNWSNSFWPFPEALNEINANSDKSKPVKRAVSKTKPRKAPAKKRGINRL